MGDQPEDKLKQRIKEVFDNYEDASADEGWLQLREKFPEKRRRRAMVWLWPAAAVILLFLGLAIWMYGIDNKRADNKKISYSINKVKPSGPASQEQKNVSAYQKKTDKKHQETRNFAYNPVAGSKTRVKPGNSNPPINTVVSKQKPMFSKQAVSVSSPVTTAQQAVILPKTNQAAAVISDSVQKSSNLTTTTLIAAVQQKTLVTDTSANQAVTVKPKSAKTILDMFTADQDQTKGDIKVGTDKKVRFGVYAATYFNYAKGSNNQVNVGAGFTADIALASNLKLVTGLSVNQNSFAYNNTGGTDPSAPAIFGTPGYNNNSENGIYTQNASLVGLDIPLDLKYVLSSHTNQFYVLAGVGSGTFINESYSYLYSNGSVASSQTSGKGFNDFYFARTLNMALGVGYPLGKDQIVIEPFVKYPLQGLGAEQLRFGASGINLKFNFSIKK